jgi:hypothetical protein
MRIGRVTTTISVFSQVADDIENINKKALVLNKSRLANEFKKDAEKVTWFAEFLNGFINSEEAKKLTFQDESEFEEFINFSFDNKSVLKKIEDSTKFEGFDFKKFGEFKNKFKILENYLNKNTELKNNNNSQDVKKRQMNSLIMVLKFILIITISCKGYGEMFNNRLFYTSIDDYDNFTSFCKCVKIKNSNSCLDNYSDFKKIDYIKYIEEYGDDDIGKLSVLTEDIVKYIESEKNKDFLALSIYLYENDFITLKLYDDMLEIFMEKDTTNMIANYELAKLRYSGGYLGLSHFLIDNLVELYPENLEVKRIKSTLENTYGTQTYDKSMNFEEYLDLNPHYIEP